MITMLIYAHAKEELKLLKDTGFEVSCKLSEDDWSFETFSNREKVNLLLEKNPLLDLALVEITGEAEVGLCERMRRMSPALYLILLTDSSVSPMTYIKPSVMAASLILRPISPRSVTAVFAESFGAILQSRASTDRKDVFVVDSREGRQLIPLSQISFFESRNKKIIVNTAYEEYAYYDTLDEIEARLGDDFVRCHRSFIVAKSKIKNVKLSLGVLLLEGDFQIPLSRSYKSIFKELR